IQAHYHTLERWSEKQLVPYCEAFGEGIIPYLPLAGGLLTGKYGRSQAPRTGSQAETIAYVQQYLNEPHIEAVKRLEAFAKAWGKSMVELAIAWLIARPQVASVIAGVTSVEQLEQNVKASEWELSPKEMEEIEKILSSE